ncbi:hypothetical protein [Spirillospora sp. NPDC029432]|uniref:hypothetical protein n=1 Tax=Spirillospora sp. NPDC029432 TaxID=3154599 RepID=UPI003454B58F
MSKREVHLVGSYPAADAGEAMTAAVRAAGGRLRTLSDGEVGERRNWVQHIIEGLRRHPDVELRKNGGWSGYDDRPVFRVRRGHRLTAEGLDLGHARNAAAGYAAFRKIRAEHGLDGLSFQVGIPGDLDLALFSFGPAGAFRYRRPFREALVREIGEVARWGRGDVLFQLEFPVELVMAATAPPPLRPAAARLLASGMTRLAAEAPPRSRFGVHLCVGDLNNRALKRMRTTAPLVALARAVLRAWPAGRDLEYVHVPLAAGEHPPVLDPRFYRDLGRLRDMPPGVRFVAGLAHEEQDLAEQRRILRGVEALLARDVAVSTACGLGRRSPENAARALERVVALADA